RRVRFVRGRELLDACDIGERAMLARRRRIADRGRNRPLRDVDGERGLDGIAVTRDLDGQQPLPGPREGELCAVEPADAEGEIEVACHGGGLVTLVALEWGRVDADLWAPHHAV